VVVEKSNQNPSEGVQRRKELRRNNRLNILAQLWRLLALVAISGGLSWLVIKQAWILRSPNQVTVQGAPDLNREQVLRATGITFPLPLLQLDPALIKQRISAALPVDQVLMQRQMLPPRLVITLSERAAVAKAQRNGIGGPEQGFIDRTGRWISPRQQAGAMGAASPNLKVVGWQSRYQPSLELLIGVLPKEADVRELRFEANGDLWVVSSKLGLVRFGPLDERLGRRVQVLSHLSKELKRAPGALGAKALDLSDPEHPELVMAAPLKRDPS
jgi:cell division protein FtsQ